MMTRRGREFTETKVGGKLRETIDRTIGKETWIIKIGKKVKGEKERNAAGCNRKDEEEEK